MENGHRPNRFKGECAALKKYGTLNNIAEALYDNGVLNDDVANEFNSIHHLKENISHYLTDLLPNIEKEQIYYVMATETLDADVEKLLGIQQVERTHQNSTSVPEEKKNLSEAAYQNLRRYLNKDYEAINQLLEMNHSTLASREVLLK